MNHFITISLAGKAVTCSLRYQETELWFQRFLSADANGPMTRIPEKDWKECLIDGMEDCAHTEYSILTPYISEQLLNRDAVLIHAVAIRWQDKAYLICAKSGTGKSTQAKTLQTLRPGQFSVICGDRPVLSFEHDCIVVYPSPWNGKENWHGAEAAPLAGVILLSRDDENKLFSCTQRDSALELFNNFIHSYNSEECVKMIAQLETRMLESVPVWKLVSSQVPDSTQLLLESVFSAETA